MVKFNQSINSFNAIISFDLALYKTGVSVYDIRQQKIAKAWEIEVKKNDSKPLLKLFCELQKALQQVIKDYSAVLLIREALPNQCGFKSSIGALQGLAKAHAILDVCRDLQEGIEEYDDMGVHSISVKAFYRTEAIPKPEKSDIRKAVVEYYKLDDTKLTDNISDSIAVTHTLLHKKWNQDIDEEIKKIKKEIKGLKAQKAINTRQEVIAELIAMKL